MALKQLVEKRNELKAKQDALDKIWDEAKLENGDLDLSRVKSLGEGQTVQAIQEKIKSMNADCATLVTDIKTLQETEQLAAEQRHAETKAGGNAGMQHPGPGTQAEQKATKSFSERVMETPEFKAAATVGMSQFMTRGTRLLTTIEGISLMTGKKAITLGSVGQGTTGVLMFQRLPGITGIARQDLRLRDLIPTVTKTEGNGFDYVVQVLRTNNASMQNETLAKAQSDYDWEARSGTIKTIAHYVKASRQGLSDIPWLQGEIENELQFGVLLKEEQQILNGDNSASALNGIIPQATAYDTGLNVTADQALDTLRHALYQARSIGKATFAPDGIVLNPFDLHIIDLIKTDEGASANKGAYLVGDARRGTEMVMLWGRPTVESDSIDADKFLVGAFGTGATIIDRMQVTVMIAYENEDDFIKNLATILAEERIGLAVRRPDSFVYGAFPQ